MSKYIKRKESIGLMGLMRSQSSPDLLSPPPDPLEIARKNNIKKNKKIVLIAYLREQIALDIARCYVEMRVNKNPNATDFFTRYVKNDTQLKTEKTVINAGNANTVSIEIAESINFNNIGLWDETLKKLLAKYKFNPTGNKFEIVMPR